MNNQPINTHTNQLIEEKAKIQFRKLWSRSKIDLTQLFSNGDPFNPSVKESSVKPLESLPEVKVEIGSNGEIADVSQINF